MFNHPHNDLSIVIDQKEKELADIRKASDHLKDEELQITVKQLNELRCDFEHNVNLLHQRDDIIKSLHKQINILRDEYATKENDIENKYRNIMNRECEELRSLLEKQMGEKLSILEEKQKVQIEKEYFLKIESWRDKIEREYHDLLNNILSSQKEELLKEFHSTMSTKESELKAVQDNFNKMLNEVTLENQRNLSCMENKWMERETSLTTSLRSEANNEIDGMKQHIHGLTKHIKEIQQQHDEEIKELFNDKSNLVNHNRVIEDEIVYLRAINEDLDTKVNDLLDVIYEAENAYVCKLKEVEDNESQMRRSLKQKDNEIKNISRELSVQELKFKEANHAASKKYKNKLKNLLNVIQELDMEMKNMRINGRECKTMKTKLEHRLKGDIETLNRKILELQNELDNERTETNRLRMDETESFTRKQEKLCRQYQQKIEALETELALERRNNETEIQLLTNEKDKVLGEKQNHMNEARRLKHLLDQLSADMNSLKQTYERDISEKNNKITKLEAQINTLTKATNELKSTISTMRHEMEMMLTTVEPQLNNDVTCENPDQVEKSETQFQKENHELVQNLRELVVLLRSKSTDGCDHGINDPSAPISSHENCLRKQEELETCICELKRELDSAKIEKSHLLNISNRLRADLNRLQSSEATSDQPNPSLSPKRIVQSPSKYENEIQSIAASVWANVVGHSSILEARSISTEKVTASKKKSLLRRKKSHETDSSKIKIRNWNDKDDAIS